MSEDERRREAQEAAERLTGWARRFMASVHYEPGLQRLGLLLAAADETRFWPLDSLSSLDALADFLEREAAQAQELDPQAAALVLPLKPQTERLELAGQPDCDLMLIVVDRYRHCATVAAPLVEGAVGGWQDLPGYVPALAPLLFDVFRSLETPRPSDTWEWGLVEAQTQPDPAALAAACLGEQAYRRDAHPKRMLQSLLDTRPRGVAWQAVLETADEVALRYQGYRPEIDREDPHPQLALLDEQAVGSLLLGCLVALERKGKVEPSVSEDWPSWRRRLAVLPRPER